MKISISASKEGYRRAGIQHSRHPRIHNVADLTEDQLRILTTDPHLKVVPVDDPPAPTDTVTGNQGTDAEHGLDEAPPDSRKKTSASKAGGKG
jgi:hypothetical protein